jgi:hypothetical protein
MKNFLFTFALVLILGALSGAAIAGLAGNANAPCDSPHCAND